LYYSVDKKFFIQYTKLSYIVDKTRASVNKADSGSVINSGRIIKGTAITSKKTYKRKGAKSNTSNKPAKVAKLQYTPEQISQLKSQMGISSMELSTTSELFKLLSKDKICLVTVTEG
jgi:hypothetical protein